MSDVEKKPNGGPRWVKIALGVSLSINLLIVGLAVGTFSQVRKGDVGVRSADGTGAYTFALQPADRRKIGRGMYDHFQQSGDDRASIRKEYDRMVEILVAETFDRAAAEQIMARQSKIVDNRRMVAEGLLLDQLEAMSLEEREKFAERLKEGARRRPGAQKPKN